MDNQYYVVDITAALIGACIHYGVDAIQKQYVKEFYPYDDFEEKFNMASFRFHAEYGKSDENSTNFDLKFWHLPIPFKKEDGAIDYDNGGVPNSISENRFGNLKKK